MTPKLGVVEKQMHEYEHINRVCKSSRLFRDLRDSPNISYDDTNQILLQNPKLIFMEKTKAQL